MGLYTLAYDDDCNTYVIPSSLLPEFEQAVESGNEEFFDGLYVLEGGQLLFVMPRIKSTTARYYHIDDFYQDPESSE